MPVALNEPLGVLQRMCEELEYSELLDNASKKIKHWCLSECTIYKRNQCYN